MMPDEARKTSELCNMKLKINAEFYYLATLLVEDLWETELYGVHVVPHPETGVYIYSSNLHAAAIFYDKEGYASCPAILKDIPSFTQAIKYFDMYHHIVRMSDDEGARLHCMNNFGEKSTHDITVESGIFVEPESDLFSFFTGKKYLKQWTEGTQTPVSSTLLNAENLNPFDRIGQSRSAYDCTGIRCSFSGEEKPILLRLENFPEFLGVTMPLDSKKYLDFIGDVKPSWLLFEEAE